MSFRIQNKLFNWSMRGPLYLRASPGAPLMQIRERVGQLLLKDFLVIPKPLPGWKLPKPKEPIPLSYRPARLFTRGPIDHDKRKNPQPIEHLLIETKESPKARPVPGKSLLLKSLCKGKGTLKQTLEGLVYLDIDDRFISGLIPYLQAYNLMRPPYFDLLKEPYGAHIPVIGARESAFHYLTDVPSLGREFSFELEGLYSVEPTDWPGVEQVWFFKLRSSELEEIRRRCHLPSKPGGHSFHIAVAIKSRLTTKKKKEPLPTMRINVGFLAA